jgi:hypothetical protein
MKMDEHVINEEAITCDEGVPGEPAKYMNKRNPENGDGLPIAQ